MNERAERINGWFAMIGVIAAMGAYALTGQVIPGVWQSTEHNQAPQKGAFFINISVQL